MASRPFRDVEHFAAEGARSELRLATLGERNAACGVAPRRNLLESRGNNPARRRFEIRRTLGSGDVWVVEYVIFYDGRPVPTVSIMESRDGKVAHETQYFADPFEAPAWRERRRETRH